MEPTRDCNGNPINRVDPSGHDSYILYDKDGAAGMDGKMFKDEAKIVKKRLESQYGKPAHLLSAKSAKQFRNKWNKRVGLTKDRNGKWTNKKASINEVYIILHGGTDGKSGYGFFDDGSVLYANKTIAEWAGISDRSVSGLEKRKIKKITLSTCYSADRSVHSLAKAFSKRMNVKTVVGYGGKTVFDYNDKGGTLKATSGSRWTWKKGKGWT